MNKITIKYFRDLTLEELYLILHARQEVFTVEQGIIYQDLDFIDQTSIHVFLMNPEKSKLMAYLRIIPSGVKYPECSMGRLLTMPRYRHRGYAREIMKTGINEAIKRYGLPIKIEAQEYLEDFYKSLGFKSISSPFILEGISHVEMILD